MTDDEFIAELEKMGRTSPEMAALAMKLREPGQMDAFLLRMAPTVFALDGDPECKAALDAQDVGRLATRVGSVVLAYQVRPRRWGVRPS